MFISNNDKTPTGAYIPKEYLQEGSVPRITVSALNNGIDDYYDSTHVNYRVYSNFISVSFLGGAFYQDKQASLDMKVHALIPKDWQFNKERAIYFLSCIRKAVHSQYSYGQQLSSSLLPNIELSLPIKDSNEINWSYIETYASAIQKKIIQNYDKDKLLEIKTTKQVVGGMNAD